MNVKKEQTEMDEDVDQIEEDDDDDDENDDDINFALGLTGAKSVRFEKQKSKPAKSGG